MLWLWLNRLNFFSEKELLVWSKLVKIQQSDFFSCCLVIQVLKKLIYQVLSGTFKSRLYTALNTMLMRFGIFPAAVPQPSHSKNPSNCKIFYFKEFIKIFIFLLIFWLSPMMVSRILALLWSAFTFTSFFSHWNVTITNVNPADRIYVISDNWMLVCIPLHGCPAFLQNWIYSCICSLVMALCRQVSIRSFYERVCRFHLNPILLFC